MEDRLSRLQRYSSLIVFGSEIIFGIVLGTLSMYLSLNLKIDDTIKIFSGLSASLALIAFIIAFDFNRRYTDKNVKGDSDFNFHVYGQFFTILFAGISIFLLIGYILFYKL